MNKEGKPSNLSDCEAKRYSLKGEDSTPEERNQSSKGKLILEFAKGRQDL